MASPFSNDANRVCGGMYRFPPPAGRPNSSGAASGGSPAAGTMSASHVVTRGAKLHGSLVSVGLDWIRGRGRGLVQVSVFTWCCGKWGRPESGPGRHFYARRWRWDCGVEMWHDAKGEGADHFTIDIPGSVLANVSGERQIEWLRELQGLGIERWTRIDLAMDWRSGGGGCVGLVAAMREGCERGELCRCRTYKPITERRANGVLMGETVYMGKRGGSGSGRYVRAYDKGLEQKACGAGEWQRLEVEFSGECSTTVASLLIQADMMVSGDIDMPLLAVGDGVKAVKGWRNQLAACVLGAVDFREVTGSKSLKRRPVAGWWAEVVDGFDRECVRVRRVRQPRLDRRRKWLREAVAPMIVGCMRRTGQGADEVFRNLCGDLDEIKETDCRAVLWEYLQAYGSVRADPDTGECYDDDVEFSSSSTPTDVRRPQHAGQVLGSLRT